MHPLPHVCHSRLLAAGALMVMAASAAQAGAFNDIYLLGDSLADQGNLFQATLAATGAGIPANDHYFDGRFANGEVYSGLLAQGLGLTLSKSSTGGNNFAYGGARANYNTVENPPTVGGFPPGLYPWSLNLERAAFEARHVNNPNALYVVFSGSNDVADLIGASARFGFGATQAQSDAAVQSTLNAVGAFKAAGARFVLVPNLPDLGLVPKIIGLNAVFGFNVSGLATALTTRFNNTLDASLSQVTGVQIIRFDTFGLLHQVHDQPARFNLSNVTEPCYTGFVEPASDTDTVCANAQSYLFWDSEHPSAAMHAVLANGMLASINAAVPEPDAAALLAAGLAVLALGRWRRRAAG